MAKLCVVKSVADRMKEAVKNGDLDIRGLYDMTSAERRATFGKYSSPELAKFINGKFEEAMVSKQKGALQDWASKTFNPQQKNGEPYKAVLKKINDLDRLGVLNLKTSDAYLEDLVADKMGVFLRPDEIKGITQRAEALNKSLEAKDANGNPTEAYWKARKDMDDYMEKLNPSSALSIITDPIRRAHILFHISGVLKKTMSEVSEGSLQATAKRLSQILTGENMAGLNNKFARDTIAQNIQTVIKTGYNPLLMQEMKDGENFLGEERPHAQGEGVLRGYARTMTNLIQHMYNTPAQFFASLSWTDTANLLSTQFANGDQAKALEFFKDATKIAPETKEGQEIRKRAIEDGLKASFQNKGALSDASIGFRNILDKIFPEFNAGKQLIPIAKVPANAIERGLDYAGLGLFKAVYNTDAGIDVRSGLMKIPEALKELKGGNKIPMQGIVRQFVQSGLGLGLAAILVHNLNPDDYLPAFGSQSSKEKSLTGAENGIFNAIKLGGRYITLSFLGPLAVPVMAGLAAKKSGALGYTIGAVESLADVPGVKQIADAFTAISNLGSKQGSGKLGKDLMNFMSDYLTSVAVPSEVKEIAAGTDSVQRDTSDNPVAKAENKIPGLRETLPPKVNEVTGDVKTEEGLASRAIMGSNLTKASDDPVVKEISRLNSSGQAPTIGNIEYASPRIKDLIKQLGEDKKTEILQYYGHNYHENAMNEINSEEYQNSDDEERKQILNSVHKDAIEETLGNFGYKKSEK